MKVPSTEYKIAQKDGKMVLDLHESLRKEVGTKQYHLLIQSVNIDDESQIASQVISKQLNVEVVEGLDQCVKYNQFNFSIDDNILSQDYF